MSNHYYITTPIYYVNDKPHIGHAYTTIACDVLARSKRLEGKVVYFLTGTDEHGQKVEKSANSKGIDPQAFTDEVSQYFRALVNDPAAKNSDNNLNILNISNDDFIRTTEARHKAGAQAFWQQLAAKGYIYKDVYSGWYSVRDEAYYQESELVDGLAPTGAAVEWVEEESYFFRLSAFQDRLLEWYDAHPDWIFPESRRNEVISFVRGGKEKEAGALKDLSISRTTFGWGVKVPGHDKHVMYVWLDALTNYITALGYPDANAPLYQQFWPANVHVVGKDILRFHAVYWPAFLMAAELPLPKRIVAHGWWTNEGQKISKSVGNVIDPIALIEQFGLDQLRYFLMREVPFGNDGNYAKEAMILRINSDLANNVGNLVQRSLSMIHKNMAGTIGDMTLQVEDQALIAKAYLETPDSLASKALNAMNNQQFSQALEWVMQIASAANEYIDAAAPWKLKKEDPKRMEVVLYSLAETIRCLAILLQPYIPDSAAKILSVLAIAEDKRSYLALNQSCAIQSGHQIAEPQPIFPRYREEEAA